MNIIYKVGYCLNNSSKLSVYQTVKTQIHFENCLICIQNTKHRIALSRLRCSGVDFTKGFKTWHKFSTEIRFMLIPIIVLFIAHEFITGNFDITGKHRAMTEHSTKIYL